MSIWKKLRGNPARSQRGLRRFLGANFGLVDLVQRNLRLLDTDQQWTNPLSLIRSAINYPNRILAAAGVAEADRDDQSARFQPEDVYDLAPASFADLDPELHDLGISWGAAKAHLHLQRHRPADGGEGR